jgi:hypothetical protein
MRYSDLILNYEEMETNKEMAVESPYLMMTAVP